MLPRPKTPELALALGNIGGPGSLTRAVVLSLGAGLSLLVAVALANTAIVAEFVERLPANAPSYYVLDITKSEWPAFTQAVHKQQPLAKIADAPMLRGRLVALGGIPVEQMKAPPEAQWVLNGDRGLTFADEVPQGSKVVAGTWWGKDYAGEPLVSFEVELARKLGLKIGDSVTVNVLGRNITARVSNSARDQVGEPDHQFRAGVLAQHAEGRALQPAGDHHPAARAYRPPRKASSSRRWRCSFRP